jgi:hypothetical protein
MPYPIRRIAIALAALAALTACDDPTAASSAANPGVAQITPAAVATIREEGWEGGAIVFNMGEGQPDAFCFFQGGTFTTNQATLVRSPNGNWTLSCRFEGLPPIAEQQHLTGWTCSIIGAPADQTHHTSWLRSPDGSAHLTCHFSDKPISDAAVSFGDVTAVAQQGSFTLPLGDLPGQSVSGLSAPVGLACTPIAADLTGRIAVIERGVCPFQVKLQNAQNAGAVAAIVYNSAALGELLVTMGGTAAVAIPGVLVGRSAGVALEAASPIEVTITHCNRSASCRGSVAP